MLGFRDEGLGFENSGLGFAGFVFLCFCFPVSWAYRVYGVCMVYKVYWAYRAYRAYVGLI